MSGDFDVVDIEGAFDKIVIMYCREIAPFETPTFSDKLGELIVCATKRPSETRNLSARN